MSIAKLSDNFFSGTVSKEGKTKSGGSPEMVAKLLGMVTGTPSGTIGGTELPEDMTSKVQYDADLRIIDDGFYGHNKVPGGKQDKSGFYKHQKEVGQTLF